jgi:hypothetical protein
VSRNPDRFFELLPLHIRRTDVERGAALRALLAVISEQVDLVQTDLEQLYDNWFIETAQPWALPYIGDLVGYKILPGYGEALTLSGSDALAARLAPRRDIADTVHDRRRKGTLPILEELASSVADSPAHAVEFHRFLLRYQPIRLYPRIAGAAAARTRQALGYIDVRDGADLIELGGPFDTQGHIAEAPRVVSPVRIGRYRPPNVAVFVWRLKCYSITNAPAYCIDRARNQFTFSILGNDSPLVSSGPLPLFITRRELADQLPDFYGAGKSFAIYRDDDTEPIPLNDIIVADLTDWFYRARRSQVVVDPELGRMMFGARSAPRRGVWVTYHYAFSADMGGGEYHRDVSDNPHATIYRVGPGQPYQRIQEAYNAWQADTTDGARPEGVIEITDSGAYQEQLEFVLSERDRLELRAADGVRPVLRLLDWYSNRPDSLQIKGIDDREGEHAKPTSRFTMDGLLVTGRGVSVTGPLGAVVFRHTTLVPGWSLEHHCEPTHPEETSLVLENTSACVQIDNSIAGTILVINDEVHTDPIDIHLTDSVLDATDAEREALSAPDCRHAHSALHARRCTVIGEVHSEQVVFAENCIFDGLMHVARRGIGCVRFCYITPGSRTPKRYHCQPDLVWAILRDLAQSGDIDATDLPRLRDLEASRVVPQFASKRYGTPAYGQLAGGCAVEITRGAEDGSELGAFHDLFQPQRQDNLRTRLAEFSPAGTDAGIIYVS